MRKRRHLAKCSHLTVAKNRRKRLLSNNRKKVLKRHKSYMLLVCSEQD